MRKTLGVHAGMGRLLAVCMTALIVLVAAPSAGAATWNLQSVPAPQSSNGNGFSVSCSSSTACMAVGFFVNPLGEEQPLSEVWNGTTWTIKTVPLPSGAPVGYLRGVSCTSATACTAVGGAGTSDFPSQPLAERWNGTSWTIQTVPSPSGQFEVTFTGVSCASATWCTAVGGANDGTHSVALAERWNGANWAAQTIPNASGATETQLNGVACRTASLCFAVGHYRTASSTFGPDKVVAERWNGTSWTVQTTPLPTGTTDAALTGVSCSAATACTAVGGYSTTNTFPNKTLAERWNGNGWTIQTTPNPAAGSPMFSSVSCPSATDCTAVGVPAGLGSTTLVEQWNGTTWTIQSAPSPAGLTQAQLSGVSCTAATACTAVGGARSGIETPPSMLAERWNGTSWAIQTTPNEPGALVSELKGASCPSATSCTAVGDFVDSTSSTKMLAEAWDGTSWAIKPVPNPPTTSGVLNAVSCTSSTACTAVGSYLGNSSLVTLAERWNGTSWSVQSTPNPSNGSSASLNAVSCASATSCMAVGNFFNTTIGHTVPLSEQWNGTSWTIKLPNRPSGTTFGTLAGVSCNSANACMSVGGFSTTTGAFQANKLLTEAWNGASWAIKTPPNPAGTTFATFTGVSCSAATACTAAGGLSTTPGDSFARAPLAERWNGTSWALQTTTNPSSEGFAGASCPAAASCSAVGSSFAESWNGTTWSTDTLPFDPAGELELAGVSCSAANACTAAGRSVQNYLIFLLFSNSAFIDTMFVPLAVRDPASASPPAGSPSASPPAGSPVPRQSIKLTRVGSHELATVSTR